MEEYKNLVNKRKNCLYCVERNPGRIQNPSHFEHDPDIVSHWSQWLGHHKPKIAIIAQDFGNIDYFMKYKGKDCEGNPTNTNLKKFLSMAGLEVGDPPNSDLTAPVYLVNSIYCAKVGAMNSPILDSWVDACTEEHVAPLMDYLKAPVVVGMGTKGWRAARRIFSLTEAPSQISKAAGLDWYDEGGTHVFAVGHCSGLGLRNRPYPQQAEDWRRIGRAVSAYLNGEDRPVPNSSASE